MLLLELFCGTKSVGKIAEERNMKVISLDINKKWNPTICSDIMDWDYTTIETPTHIWASPDCATYSIAAHGVHFNNETREPKTDKARKNLLVLARLKEIINYFTERNPDLIYYIENPRGKMRWFISEYPRYTITYCSYGFDRMKPTDIWTNVKGFEPKMCKNGCPNHIRSPRGSRNGSQSIPIAQRYSIPPNLIVELLEKDTKGI